MSPRVIRTLVGLAITLVPAFSTGCGFDRIQPTPPETIDGINFETLSEIQDDETLTNDEKRQAIRDAVNAPLTPDGDRLVEFLLTFPTP